MKQGPSGLRALIAPGEHLMKNLRGATRCALVASACLLPSIGLLALVSLDGGATILQAHLGPALGFAAGCLLIALYLLGAMLLAQNSGLAALRHHLIAISSGDLRLPITIERGDEIADLLRELGYMQAALRETTSEVRGASDMVVQASIGIARGTQDLAARTEAAAAALEESSAALEQTSATVRMTAEAVGKASDIAVDNAAVASHAGRIVSDVVTTMERIQTSSSNINEIISVIDGIAFQTNILALNAAVEAARAGDQGKGFAVVASEVRALAQRSAGAAREVKALISTSGAEVEAGMAVVRGAGDTMQGVVRNADLIQQLLDEVATGAREQSLGIGQIQEAIQELDRTTQSNANMVQVTASSAASQRDEAIRMAAFVDEFRLPGTVASTSSMVQGIDVDAVIDGHRQWKVKLREAIEEQAQVDVASLSRDDCCALGKWVHGDGTRWSASPRFTELVQRHAHFHRVAGGVGEMINRQEFERALDALAAGTAFSQATRNVVESLAAAKRLGFPERDSALG